jgi:DNA-binding NarL/FixJ family response regulator
VIAVRTSKHGVLRTQASTGHDLSANFIEDSFLEIKCGLQLIASNFAGQLADLANLQQQDSALNSASSISNVTGELRMESAPKKYQVKLIVDCPQGFALHELRKVGNEAAQLDCTVDMLQNKVSIVVVTFSCCAEYWEDLWDLQPHILLVNPRKNKDLIDAIIRAEEGGSYRNVPFRFIRLTNTERRALNYLALGGTNRQIAEQLCLQDQTIMNMLSVIYRKLNLKNRAEAIHYYWGSSYTSLYSE